MATYLQRLVIRTNGRVLFVRTDDISRIETANNYLRVHATDGVHVIRGTMRDLEGRLDPNQFLRIHRRVLVNFDHIREVAIEEPGVYRVNLRDGSSYPLGRSFRGHVLGGGG